jgi:hypothetical protein
MLIMMNATNTETVYCGSCYRREVVGGECPHCGPVATSWTRRRADAVKVGDEVVEACGYLLRVARVEELPRGMVRLHLVSFGPSPNPTLTARKSRPVSIAVKVAA